jgi:hypothetical protein
MRAMIVGLAIVGMLPGIAIAQSDQPQASSQTTSNKIVKHTTVETTSVPSEGANSFTEGQARERIAKAGFTRVSKLVKDDAGLWQGTAHQHRRTVHVALDYKGNVTGK